MVSDPAPSDVRRILHCDMDCFYAAVHQRDDPSLAGKPLVIGGSPDRRGVVAAASYEVRRFGVRSAMPSSQARRLCPQAIFLPPEFSRYREESRKVFEIFRSFTDVVQPVSIDEAYLDVTEQVEAWGSATAIAEAVRARIRDERRLTVSVGVGPNRLIAKIASDRNKPDGLTVVPPARVLDFLAPLEVRNLQGVGPATERVLNDELGVRTVRELRSISEATLARRFGRFGETLFRYALGIDDRPVLTETERKSLSSERTYDQDLVGLEVMDAEIDRQARGVAEALTRRGLAGATIQIKVRYEDFTTITRSATLSAPTDDGSVISELGRELLRRTQAGERAVRLLGVGVAKLVEDGEPRQLALPGGGRGALAGSK
ncbi:MAG TPA: DNA polymerase IV [Thermoanaerobaculia bacterium]|nr:DNA polymerase IV [Thermoanaerobaculia bacterium]